MAKFSIAQSGKEENQFNGSSTLSTGQIAQKNSKRRPYVSASSLYITNQHLLQEKMGLLT